MSYKIISYMSRGYEPALRWVLPSWLRPEVEEILLVTDFVPDNLPAKVRVVAQYPASEDWLVNNCRRAEMAARWLPDGQVAFLDLDCWILRDITEVFGPPGTIAVTRFWSKEAHTGGTITDGAFFANVNSAVRDFCREWDRRVKANPYTHTQVGAAVTNQYRFTELCREAYKTGKPAIVLTAPEQLFNAEHSIRDALLAKCRQYAPSIVHLKGGQWKESRFVQQVLDACEGK